MMNALNRRWVRVALIMAVLLGGVFSIDTPAKAQDIQTTAQDTVPAGTVVENDIVLRGTDVSLDGDVVGDVLAVGSNVTVNGKVDGSLIAIGRDITVNGSVAGTTYSVASAMELGEGANLARNLYFIGLDLTTQPGSTVGRDLVVLSLGAKLDGMVGRQTRGIIGPLQLIQVLIEQVRGRLSDIPAGSSDSAAASQAVAVQYSGLLPPAEILGSFDGQTSIDRARLQEWFLRFVLELIPLLVFGLLGLWLLPSYMKRGGQKLRAKPLRALGIGLLALVIAFNLILVAVLIASLIFVFGLWLGTIGLWDLTWVVWGIGFPALALVVAVSAIFVDYGSKVLVAYLVGVLILERLIPRATRYRLWPLLLGLVLYVLLLSIPYFGWVLSVVVTACGLGAAWMFYRERNQAEATEASVTPDQEVG
jgi:cytoskeletal protein CcmA (bactofilin family)